MTHELLPISVTILTKNSAKYLNQVLDALKAFDEVVVYDTGSSDQTIEIASRYPNVNICEGPLKGFGPTHNHASSNAKHDWILSLDSDEILTMDLLAEIRSLLLNPRTVYSFPRKNFFRGKWIRWCGWSPDRQYRLYHRQQTRFNDAQVHEAILLEGLHTQDLHSPILHFPYDTTSDFLNKMQTYSSLFAQQYQGKRSSSLGKALGHATFAFFKSYVLKKGFLGGYEGFVISVYNANTAFYKYLKLEEANRQKRT